ncbi:MAG: ATP-binding cassette domain-containing protein [Acidobacteria bacterium]|nr:ATP-binding cassette domain-containing protein [Acidobacteriota bacterium]
MTESLDAPEAAESQDSIVEFRQVSYSAGGNSIIDGLSFEVRRGEILVLLGESGCGKTTTLKLINSLLEPTDGEVLVESKRTTEWDAISLRRRIGYVLQDGGLFPHLTIRDNAALVLSITGSEPGGTRKRANEMLELVGLDPAKFGDRFPHELSGGQRQRVGVARALAADPDLLLLDEPFGALDALTRTRLQREFAKLVRDLGKTAVFVTHDLPEAMLLADRIALMDKGRIELLDDAASFAHSDNALARAYFDTIAIPS